MKKISFIIACTALFLVSCQKDKYDEAIEKLDAITTSLNTAIESDNLDSVSVYFNACLEIETDSTITDTMNMSKSQLKDLHSAMERRDLALHSYAEFIKDKRADIILSIERFGKVGPAMMKLIEIGVDYTFDESTGSIITSSFTSKGVNYEAAIIYVVDGTILNVGLYASEEMNSIENLESIPNVIGQKHCPFSFLGVETGLNEVWVVGDLERDTDYEDFSQMIEEFNRVLDLSKANGSYTEYVHLKTNHYHVTKEEEEASRRAAQEAFEKLYGN